MKIISTGKLTKVQDGLAWSDGLSGAGYGEEVLIETPTGNVRAVVLDLDEYSTGLIVLDKKAVLKPGMRTSATNTLLSVPADNNLLGKIIDPLGRDIDSLHCIVNDTAKLMPLERVAPGVTDRKNVHRPLFTGMLGIDCIIPIGKGQRQLIIGDRQTGKTSIAVDTIINQKSNDVICIYVSIGQKNARLAQLAGTLKEQNALPYTIIIAANAADPAALQYLAPYSGTAIAEYFAEQGKDVLIIYDDLTKHAWAYRQLSLLLNRPPGREAYPGDIFYLHSKLLERGLQYSEKNKGGSITCLPIVETLAGDISAYIPTNIISITDGQIFLDSDLYNAGQLPAINYGSSVSRVGGDAQLKPMKQFTGRLKLELSQYRELLMFSQFGSDMDDETKQKLKHGSALINVLNQKQYEPFRYEDEILIILCGVHGIFDDIEPEYVWKVKNLILQKCIHSFQIISRAVQKNVKLSDLEINETVEETQKVLRDNHYKDSI